jgi:hypothetical protein
MAEEPPVLVGAPPGFVAHVHRYAFSVPQPGERVGDG